METQLEYCQFFLSMKKVLITEAMVSGESYLGNVASLFRPSTGVNKFEKLLLTTIAV